MSEMTAKAGRPGGFPWRGMGWWPMLIPLAGLAASLVLGRFDEFFQRLQNALEWPAPFIIGLAAGVYALRFARQREELFLLLACLAAAMTLREVHDLPGLKFMDKGVYIAAGLVGVGAFVWRRRLDAPLRGDLRHTSWLLATFAAYFLALLVQRRVFRFVPGEQHIHRSLEECAETVAHLMFLTTSLLASWRRPPKS